MREAIADAQRLVDTQPRSPSSFTQLGRALCHADRYPDAAAALLGALELQPDDSEARLRFDQVLEAIRPDGARRHFVVPAVPLIPAEAETPGHLGANTQPIDTDGEGTTHG